MIGEVAAYRSESGWFTTASVRGLFEDLRVPAPANISANLSGLRRSHFVVRPSDGSRAWAITPEGRERIRDLALIDLDYSTVAAELNVAEGAELGHGLHTVIPATFAPLRWSTEVRQFLEVYPFDNNVFCMTRFPKDETDEQSGEYLDPVTEVIDVTRTILSEFGLVLHLASDRQILDDLWGNVAAHIWASKYGIGLLEDRQGRGLNYNVMTELGSMLVTGRRCALLKDSTAPVLPSDFTGQIYKSVDFDDLAAVEVVVREWVREDLRIR